MLRICALHCALVRVLQTRLHGCPRSLNFWGDSAPPLCLTLEAHHRQLVLNQNTDEPMCSGRVALNSCIGLTSGRLFMKGLVTPRTFFCAAWMATRCRIRRDHLGLSVQDSAKRAIGNTQGECQEGKRIRT